MPSLSNRSLFGIAVLCGFATILALAGYDYWRRSSIPRITPLTGSISVSTQISLESMEMVQQRGFATIVDLRPDGEAPDQPPSGAVEAAAKAMKIGFFYVPVPHGDKVPAEVVDRLSQAIASAGKPILLYCRSGRRATRAWSLAEASLATGLPLEDIERSAKRAGHAIDDLVPAIKARIAQRNSIAGYSP